MIWLMIVLFTAFILKDGIKAIPKYFQKHKRFKIGNYFVKIPMWYAEEFENQIAMLDVYTSLMDIKREIYKCSSIYPIHIMYNIGGDKGYTLLFRRLWFSERIGLIGAINEKGTSVGHDVDKDLFRLDGRLFKINKKLHNIEMLKMVVKHIQTNMGCK